MQNNKHKMDKLYGLENFELFKIGREFRKKTYKVIKNGSSQYPVPEW